MHLAERLNCLPSEVLKEDMATIYKGIELDAIYRAVKTATSAVGDDIHKLPPGVQRIIQELREQDLYHGISDS